jgi:hypothetical protein
MIRPLSCLLVPALLVAAPTPKILSPAGTVGKQIEHFNAHDLEGFLALFAEDLEVGEIPAGASAPTGKAKLREVYADRFRANPDLHASADSQMVSGEFVIQKETIKGRAGNREALKTVVIYQVKAGKIVRMWLLRE